MRNKIVFKYLGERVAEMEADLIPSIGDTLNILIGKAFQKLTVQRLTAGFDGENDFLIAELGKESKRIVELYDNNGKLYKVVSLNEIPSKGTRLSIDNKVDRIIFEIDAVVKKVDGSYRLHGNIIKLY